VKTRSVIVRWLLALLLLVSQQLAVVHAVSHISDARPHASQHKRQDKQPAEQSCAQCLAFAQIDSAINGSTIPAIDTGVAEAVRVVARARRAGTDTFSAFRSRAPPIRA
jgi:hypothetical protein